MERQFYALDLKDDPALIKEYKKHHEEVWPDILRDLKKIGIHHMEIYCTGNRLVMMIEVPTGFSFDEVNRSPEIAKRVEEWEELMWKYQQRLPHSKKGQKWVRMEKIFEL